MSLTILNVKLNLMVLKYKMKKKIIYRKHYPLFTIDNSTVMTIY